ncbi:MAG: hypothetical protein M9921_10115 [Fimbriimonadaceae bacterium]|nr:hypothetical protein [Fimbriimonadaceae bacterium]
MNRIPVGMAQAVEKTVPEIVDLVQQSGDEPILIKSGSFDEPELFFQCVWYALSYQKRVLIEPDQRTKPH